MYDAYTKSSVSFYVYNILILITFYAIPESKLKLNINRLYIGFNNTVQLEQSTSINRVK